MTRLPIPPYVIDEQNLNALEGIYRKVADVLIQDGYWTMKVTESKRHRVERFPRAEVMV